MTKKFLKQSFYQQTHADFLLANIETTPKINAMRKRLPICLTVLVITISFSYDNSNENNISENPTQRSGPYGLRIAAINELIYFNAALGSSRRIYIINWGTDAATAVGASPFAMLLS